LGIAVAVAGRSHLPLNKIYQLLVFLFPAAITDQFHLIVLFLQKLFYDCNDKIAPFLFDYHANGYTQFWPVIHSI
jgi:hypothetical protein